MGSDMYIHASLRGLDCSPIIKSGILMDEELKIQPTLIWSNHNLKPITKIKKESMSNSKLIRLPINLVKEPIIISIDTKPPHQ